MKCLYVYIFILGSTASNHDQSKDVDSESAADLDDIDQQLEIALEQKSVCATIFFQDLKI